MPANYTLPDPNKQFYPGLPTMPRDRLLRGINRKRLEGILQCHDLADLNALGFTKTEFPDVLAVLKGYTQNVVFSNQKIAQAISTSLTEAPSYSISAGTVFIEMVSAIGVLALSVFTVVVGVVSTALIGAFIWTIYKELDAKKQLRINELALNGLKLEVLKELTHDLRRKQPPQKVILMMLGVQHAPKNKQMETIDSMRHMRRVLEAIVVVASTLLCTHVLAIGLTVSATMGISLIAFATTPLGLGLLLAACVISIGVGLYFGYKANELGKQELRMEAYQNNIKRKCVEYTEKYEGYRRAMENHTNPHAAINVDVNRPPIFDGPASKKESVTMAKPSTVNTFVGEEMQDRYAPCDLRT
jgi:hypothetical protein